MHQGVCPGAHRGAGSEPRPVGCTTKVINASGFRACGMGKLTAGSEGGGRGNSRLQEEAGAETRVRNIWEVSSVSTKQEQYREETLVLAGAELRSTVISTRFNSSQGMAQLFNWQCKALDGFEATDAVHLIPETRLWIFLTTISV